jgi:hypothetical protein
MSLRIILIFAGAFAWIWSVYQWRRALQAVMVLLILEGAIRKWVFPGAQDLVYFAKDVLLLGTYAGFLRDHRGFRAPRAAALYTSVALAAVFGLAEIFNPSLPNLLVGLLGWKAYFFYAPLLVVLPAAFPTDLALARFLRRYVLIAIPVGLLALAQFFSPASSVLNTYARAEGESRLYATTFGNSSNVRVTATFSYITGYASYLLATAILILAVLGTTRWRLRRNLFVYLALGLTFLGMLMAGSRGSILVFALVLPLYWWLTVLREQQGGTTLMRILLALSVIAAVVSYAGSDALDAFKGRAAGTGDELLSRMSYPAIAPWELVGDAGSFGFGIGSTHQTAEAVTHGMVPYGWLRGLSAESETGKVMIELGPIGFALVYFLRTYLIFFALRQALRLRTPFHRAVATTSCLFFLAELLGSVIFDVTSDLFYWFFGGLLMAVIHLDRAAAAASIRAATAGAPAPHRPGAQRAPQLPRRPRTAARAIVSPADEAG